jgi:serine protease AprX
MKGKRQRWIWLIVIGLAFFSQRPTQGQPAVNAASGLDAAIARSLQATVDTLHVNRSTADLRVAEAHTVTVPDIAFTAYAVKILDPQQERIYQYWYNETGHPTTEQAVFNARAAAYVTRYGHLSRDLYSHLASSSATASIPVAVWAEQALGSDVPPAAYPHKIYLPLVIRGGVACGTPVECVVQFIQNQGYSVDYVSSEVPVVYATLPSTVINTLQAQTYVAAIYEQETGEWLMDSAVRTSAAPWTWERGITGEGIKIAVLENDGVAFDNPYLYGNQYYMGWWKRVGDHATQVAGVASANHSQYSGIAFGAEILSANALTLLESDVVAAADWAVDAGADIINASFGTTCGGTSITSYDKYFDWVVWEKRKTVTVSAGNVRDRCSSNHNVSSPGKAYNVITVGAKDDKNTAQTEADVADDQFSYFSCYVDPDTASSNRLKPEVVAVGQRIITMSTADPWVGVDEIAGTSFSAPIVAGQAALMMQRSSWLTFSPEAVKAGIMTTARWTSLKDDVDPSQQASIDKMGVGAIDTTAADNSLINGRIQGLYMHQMDFPNGYYDINFEVTVPERIRVIIVWSSHPNRVWITNWILHDRLESDFDLTVRAPNGQVFGSYADEANYEIVEFEAPVTGTYRARIHLSRWDDSSMEERVGFAWYSGAPLP